MIRKRVGEKARLFGLMPMLILVAMIAFFVCSVSQQASACVPLTDGHYYDDGT